MTEVFGEEHIIIKYRGDYDDNFGTLAMLSYPIKIKGAEK